MKVKNSSVLTLLFITSFLTISTVVSAQLSYAKAEQIIDKELYDWRGCGFFSLRLICYVKGSADVEDIIKTGNSEYLVKGVFEWDMGNQPIFKARFRITGSGKVKILKLCTGYPSEETVDWRCKTYY